MAVHASPDGDPPREPLVGPGPRQRRAQLHLHAVLHVAQESWHKLTTRYIHSASLTRVVCRPWLGAPRWGIAQPRTSSLVEWLNLAIRCVLLTDTRSRQRVGRKGRRRLVVAIVVRRRTVQNLTPTAAPSSCAARNPPKRTILLCLPRMASSRLPATLEMKLFRETVASCKASRLIEHRYNASKMRSTR